MLKRLIKWVTNNLIFIIVAVLILVVGLNCLLNLHKSTPENVGYSAEYKIGDYTVNEFLERCKKMIKSAYAPESLEEYIGITEEYKDIATELCLNQLCKDDVELSGVDFNNTVEIKDTIYGYKYHQDNQKDKVYMELEVTQGSLSWDINIELEVNGEINKIDNINVW